MKKIITATVAASLIAGIATAEVAVTMDFVSAYVFRGVTLLDGASFQPGIEASGFGLAEEYGAVAAGAWGSMDLDDENGAGSTFQESDWYVSYSLPIESVDVSVGYCEYAYAAGAADKEFSVGLGYDLSGVALGAGAYFMTGGDYVGQFYADFSVGYDLEVTEEFAVSLGARLGYIDPAAGESGFSDYDLSIGTSYPLSETWSASVSLAYIGEIDKDVLETDVDVVGMFGLACEM